MSLTGGIGDSIGELFIKIAPDTKEFGKHLKSEVSKESAGALKNIQKSSQVALGAVTAIGGGLIALGSQLDDAYDGIRANTTATGAELEGLNKSFENVAKGSTESLDVASSALSALYTRLGVTGKPLETLTQQFLDLSHVTGEDVTAAIDKMASVFLQFGIKGAEQNKVLDELFNVSKAAGVSVTELATQLNKSGGALQGLGFTFDESINFLGLLNKNGVDANKAILGLGKQIKKFAEAGVPAKEAIRAIFDEIKNLPDATLAAAKAQEVFGARAGPQLAQAIRAGTLSVDDLAKSLGAGTDTISGVAAETADAAETFAKLKNNLAITLGPAANKLFSAFAQAASDAAPAILSVVQALTPLLLAFASLPTPVLASIVGFFAVGSTLDNIVGPIKNVVGAFKGLSAALSTNPWVVIIAGVILLTVLVVKNWDKIKKVVGAALDWIGRRISEGVALFKAVWSAAWEAIGGVVDAVGSAIGTAIAAVENTITSVFNAIGAFFASWALTVQTAFAAVVGYITGPIDFILGIPGRIAAVFTGVVGVIVGPFRAAFNGIAKAWNSTVGKLSFTVPDWIPLVGGKSFDVPDIPAFANGGLIRKGTTAWVGENGPELFQAGATGFITDNRRSMAAAGAGGASGVTVTGPLVMVQQMIVRDDQDIRKVSRDLNREVKRAVRAAGGAGT